MDKTGGPAYPNPDIEVNDIRIPQPGMTLLDYFAGQALQSLITIQSPEPGEELPELRAKRAYEYAAAMLAEKGRGNDVR